MKNAMKDLNEIVAEIKQICDEHPVMEDRVIALSQAGYQDIKYRYLKSLKTVIWSDSSHGLLTVFELPRKQIYRIQVGYTELQKGYPAAWCVDVSSTDVDYKPELPF